MLSSAEKLKAAGARLLISPDNTIHRAWPWVAPRAPLPWLHTVGVVGAEACDAVVLGCTGIPLIVNDQSSPLPVLDSTRRLARAALKRSVEG